MIVHGYIHNAHIYKFQFAFMCWQGIVYNHKLCAYWSQWIFTIQKHKRTIDLQKGVCLKSLQLMMFQRIIFSCQHEIEELNLTARFPAVSAAPRAEWCNLLGPCRDHSSEAENMLGNLGWNPLGCLDTYFETAKVTEDSPDLILNGRLCVLVLRIAPAHQKNDKVSPSFQRLDSVQSHPC